MDTVGRLKLIIIGLILLAIGIGYFIFAQRTSVQPGIDQQAIIEPSPSSSPQVISQASSVGSPLPKTGISSLPSTGIPVGLMAIFAISAAIAGWGLRQYPK